MDVNEILAALNLDEDEETPEAGTTATGQQDENSVIRGLRDQLKKARADSRTLAKEVTDLREFKTTTETTVRSSTLESAAKDLSLDVDLKLLYPADREATPEAVKAWALEARLIKPAEGGTTEAAEVAEGFVPQATNAGGQSVQILSDEDFTALRKSNPTAAIQAVRDGRYKLETSL